MAFFDFFPVKRSRKRSTKVWRRPRRAFGKLKRTFVGRRTIDDDFLDELEEIFITGDVGAETTLKIIDRIQARAQRDKYVSEDELNNMLCEEISDMLVENSASTAQLADFAIPEADETLCDNGGRCERGRQNDNYRQAGLSV